MQDTLTRTPCVRDANAPVAFRGARATILGHAMSNAAVAAENYADLARRLPDAHDRARAERQAREKSGDIALLAGTCAAGRADDVLQRPPCRRPWLQWRRHFVRERDAGRLAACVLIQDGMMSSVGMFLCRVLAEHVDVPAARAARLVLQHDRRHAAIGAGRVLALRRHDAAGVEHALVHAQQRLMPGALRIVGQCWMSLQAGIASRDRGRERLAGRLEALRADALDAYLDWLGAAGFDLRIAVPLVASLSRDGDLRSKPSIRLRADAAPWRSGGHGHV